MQTGGLLLEEDLEQSEDEEETPHHQELQTRKAAWVDEDDELDEE